MSVRCFWVLLFFGCEDVNSLMVESGWVLVSCLFYLLLKVRMLHSPVEHERTKIETRSPTVAVVSASTRWFTERLLSNRRERVDVKMHFQINCDFFEQVLRQVRICHRFCATNTTIPFAFVFLHGSTGAWFPLFASSFPFRSKPALTPTTINRQYPTCQWLKSMSHC